MASNAYWNVSVWVDGATRPVESVDFSDRKKAEKYANRRRAEIKGIGSTHKVSVSPAFIQA